MSDEQREPPKRGAFRATRRNALREAPGGIRYWRTHGLHLDPDDYRPTAFYRAVAPHGQMMAFARKLFWGQDKLARQPGRFTEDGKPLAGMAAKQLKKYPAFVKHGTP
jgi:hypothetical protein